MHKRGNQCPVSAVDGRSLHKQCYRDITFKCEQSSRETAESWQRPQLSAGNDPAVGVICGRGSVKYSLASRHGLNGRIGLQDKSAISYSTGPSRTKIIRTSLDYVAFFSSCATFACFSTVCQTTDDRLSNRVACFKDTSMSLGRIACRDSMSRSSGAQASRIGCS